MIQYSREFMDLVRRIGDCKSKQEEDTIVGREVTSLKAHFVDLETGEPRTDNILKVAGGVVGALVLLTVIRKIVR